MTGADAEEASAAGASVLLAALAEVVSAGFSVQAINSAKLLSPMRGKRRLEREIKESKVCMRRLL